MSRPMESVVDRHERQNHTRRPDRNIAPLVVRHVKSPTSPTRRMFPARHHATACSSVSIEAPMSRICRETLRYEVTRADTPRTEKCV